MLVSVSTMPAEDNLKDYLLQIKDYADFLHCDVCDGKYNNAVYFSPQKASEINAISTLPLDVHLMTKDVLKNAKQYIKAGANIVTAQTESFADESRVFDFVNFVKSHKTLVGLSIEPNTSVDKLLPFLSSLDVVLVMAVQTGKSGQKFDALVLDKIEQLNALKTKNNYHFKIEVDGGIDDKVAKILKDKGADIVVSGSYVFKSPDKLVAINNLK